MRILAIDIGAGTQDILLFDSTLVPANWVKMIMPSPSVIVAGRIDEATKKGKDTLLKGVTMGGGACASALARHIKAGRKAFATPDAARTFDDDLAEVEKLGVTIVSEDEAKRLKGLEGVEMKDLDLDAISAALAAFGVKPRFDGLAVAVLDHGAAPPGVSDRAFRFEHLCRLVQENNTPSAFAYLAGEVAPYLTRMKAVAQTMKLDVPLLLMDTPAAGAMGALQDPEVARHHHRVIVNNGNAHTLAFHMAGDEIYGLFEHHTGLLTTEKLDSLIGRLVSGSLTREDIFGDGGHGALILRSDSARPFIAVTGPRRSLMAGSSFQPYFAAPHGDMMLTGAFGLVRAFAYKVETWKDEIIAALSERWNNGKRYLLDIPPS